MEFVTFTIIVDDIVYPDGHTAMMCLGGGGPQTAFGMKLWASSDERVGLAAGIGPDFSPSCRSWLEDLGIDCAGLKIWASPTLRAWQILEDDGRRSQVWRVKVGEEVWGMLRPSIAALPPSYQQAKAYHVCVHPSTLDVDFIRELRGTGAEVVSIETYMNAEDILTRPELEALVSAAHIFSPNEREASSLIGPGPPLEMVDRLVELGAQVIALRRGSLGCVVHRADTGETYDVPAFHTVVQSLLQGTVYPEVDGQTAHCQVIETGIKDILDPTGCGNSFCGGFLAGWWKTKDLLTAALWGSVAASFMLEYEGVPPPTLATWKTQADWRLKILKPHARRCRPY